METDLIFGAETGDAAFGAISEHTQTASAATAAPPFDDPLPQPLDAAQVVIPHGQSVFHVPVTPGEVVVLPFGADAHFLAETGHGNLAIKVGDVTVILEGYLAATTPPPVIEAADGTPLDIAAILAATDPAINIETAAGPGGGQGGQGADNTGAIFQAFGDGPGGLGGFQGAGGQGDSEGPNGGPGVDQTGTSFRNTNTVTNTAPVAEDLKVETDEDHDFAGTLPATDADGDPLTYSVVGALPKYVTVNKDGTWSFDPAGHYDQLDTGDHETVTFQYKANDGTSDSNTSTVTIELTGVNDVPRIATGVYYVGLNEEQSGFINPGLSVSDPDDSVFTLTTGALPTGVSYDPATDKLSFDLAGHYDYLAAGEITEFVANFQASDGEATSADWPLTIGIMGLNDAPVIAGTGAPLAYTENDPATAIAGAATITDVDSKNFNGGSLTVAFTANGKVEDALSIINQGTGAGQIGISGADVTYGGSKIGTWSGGVNGADLVITFTSDDATPAAAQALLRDIAYANSSNNPSGADRTVHFTLVDGDGTDLGGTDTGAADATIHVTPVNDAPIARGVHFFSSTEETTGGGLQLASFGVIDPDSSSFTFRAVSALPTGVTFDSNGDIHVNLAGHYDSLSAGELKTVSFDYVINDGQADSAPAHIEIDVNGVNDAPVIAGTGAGLSYTEADPAKAIAGAATVADIDSANFNGGSLTVSFTANGKAEDQLSILNQGTGAGEIGISGTDVTYGGVTIGTWAGGANGADLVITFTSDAATAGAAQALLQHIAYANSSANPSGADRTVHFTLVDGDGTANGGTDTGTADATIHVTPVNQAPVAKNDFFSTDEDTKLTIAAPGVLANDFDPDGNAIVAGSFTQPAHGSVALLGDGSFVYTPFAHFSGTDRFTYKASDSSSQSKIATVFITVFPVDHPPVPGAVPATITIADQIGGDRHGTTAHETIVGSAAGDKIDGGGGKDLVFGGDGDDTVFYHAGDTVQGGGDTVPHEVSGFEFRGDVLAIDHDVDFTKLDLAHFGGIETLSASDPAFGGGNAAQSIALNAASVASLSDHTLAPDALFGEHAAIRVDLESVDQLYLSISKAGDGWTQYAVSTDYAIYAHETTAGSEASTDAYVIVHTPIANPNPAAIPANVHLNADAP